MKVSKELLNPKPYRLFLVILSLLCSIHVSAQDLVEFGVPQTINTWNIPSFFNKHGAYVHFGHIGEKNVVHGKLYSGATSRSATEYGLGFGVARIISFLKIPKLHVDFGVGLLYVHKSESGLFVRKAHYPSVFLESKVRYNVWSRFYISTELTWGYGYQIFYNPIRTEGISLDVPYLFSIGVGFNLHDRTP